VPNRLDFVHFRVGRDDLRVAVQVALELTERARRAPDEAAQSAAAKIVASASRPIGCLSSPRRDVVALSGVATSRCPHGLIGGGYHGCDRSESASAAGSG
jgi:hypothetical protein